MNFLVKGVMLPEMLGKLVLCDDASSKKYFICYEKGVLRAIALCVKMRKV